jgi:beta-glucosidase
MKKTDKLTVTVKLKNNNSVTGEEVVQLYIRDYTASVVRPVKELKGFQKIKLVGGSSQTVTFTLSAKDLSFFDADGNTIFEPGKFSVFVGGNSRDVLEAKFEVK